MNAIPDYMQLREKWGRLAQLGTAEVILGIVALSTMHVSVAAAVMLFGWILVVSGILEAVQAFQFRKPLGFFLHIIAGIAAIPIGLLMATGSATKPFAWTLLFGSIFIVVGLLRIIAAFVFKFQDGDGLSSMGALRSCSQSCYGQPGRGGQLGSLVWL